MGMALKRTSHAVYDTKYHLVWAPKYRKRMTDEVRGFLKSLFPRIARDFGFQIEVLEVASDHIHLFLSFPPRYSISKIVGIFKSISAQELFQEFPQLRQQLWSGHFWETGYFVRTVGDEVTAQVIQRYIQYHQDPDSDLRLF